jgi:hypothetical protein
MLSTRSGALSATARGTSLGERRVQEVEVQRTSQMGHRELNMLRRQRFEWIERTEVERGGEMAATRIEMHGVVEM